MNKDYKLTEEQNSGYACEPEESWGGSWTEQKLETFEKYVNAYLTIMNVYRDKYNWNLIYFDGFAGSGSRGDDNSQPNESSSSLFSDLKLEIEELTPYKGAAERVLGIKQRGFDYYYFIDKGKEANNKLKTKLESQFKNKNLRFRPYEANSEIEKMASFLKTNSKYKALVLLDPFGMQIRWETIKMLGNTGTDLWILIPTGVIVNRLLDRKGELKYNEKLVSFFGKDEDFLREYFYKKH